MSNYTKVTSGTLWEETQQAFYNTYRKQTETQLKIERAISKMYTENKTKEEIMSQEINRKSLIASIEAALKKSSAHENLIIKIETDDDTQLEMDSIINIEPEDLYVEVKFCEDNSEEVPEVLKKLIEKAVHAYITKIWDVTKMSALEIITEKGI